MKQRGRVRSSISVVGILFAMVMFVLVASGQDTDEAVNVRAAVAPFYPPAAMALLEEGRFEIPVKIAPNGDVGEADFKNVSKMFAPALKLIVPKWKFSAAPPNQKKDRTVTLVFVFVIKPQGTNRLDLLPIFRPPYEVEIRDTPAYVETSSRRERGNKIRTFGMRLTN